ncbi:MULTISPECIES: alpha/beta family hydrolase [Fictibacillus]|jgi:alpha/beta superfamily hydrolase|uniref:alpha/beta family hydrolase n=1 Tax=Fictibacillus TaxID=1329200 RepID=UPI00102A4C49|nr:MULTISPECIES: alpha/beta family hydrolase [Fictibacillus]RZT23854.1 alpha/beta superfamily hydrolase [Fictibacillus sp. BK138]
MKVREGIVKGYKEMKVPYAFLNKSENPTGLAIVLPGMGYTVKSPILHFATGAYLNRGYDVLHINYEYHTDPYDHFTFEEVKSALASDVMTVLHEALYDEDYKSYYLVGKSFGCLAMPEALNFAPLQKAKTVWLTPHLKEKNVFETMLNSQNKGLCMIGDRDSFYNKESLEQLQTNRNIDYFIPPGADHALEIDGQTLESIDLVKRVVKMINEF